MRSTRRLALATLMAVAVVGIPLPAQARDPSQGGPSTKPAIKPLPPVKDPKTQSLETQSAASFVDLPGLSIESGSPLTRIGVSPDLNCYVNHVDDTMHEFYGDTACGTFVVWQNVLYGPQSIPFGGGASPRTGFTPVSQTMSGDGSSARPWLITTEVRLGSTGLRLIQTDEYVNGGERFLTNVQVINESAAGGLLIIYRAADCFLQDSDLGFGSLEASRPSIACVEAEDDGNGGFVPGRRVEEWLPVTTDGVATMEGGYDEVWSWIGTKRPFENDVRTLEHIDNGAGLSWQLNSNPGSTSVAVHWLTISPTLATGQQCDAEQLIELPSDGTPVTVRYDPRFIADESEPGFEQAAAEIATKLRARANLTRAEYHDVLHFTVADRLTISIECNLTLRGAPVVPHNTPAVTDAHDQIHLRSDWIYQRFKAPDAALTYASWAQTLDHEIFHTIQGSSTLLGDLDAGISYLIDGNRSIAESSAQLAQDLLVNTDDEDNNGLGWSYLDAVNTFINDPGSIDTDHPDGGREYRAAGFIQYLGEQYGPSGGTLEDRVAAFLRVLNFESPTREAGYQWAIITGGANRPDFTRLDEAVRDYLVTMYAHEAPNIGDPANVRWRLLDEKTPHGGTSIVGEQQDYHDFTAASKALGDTFSVPLQEISGDVFEVPLPTGPTKIQVTASSGPIFPDVTLAVLPVAANGTVTIDGRFMGRGELFSPVSVDVDTAGAAKVAIVVVCAVSDPCTASVSTRDISPPAPLAGAGAKAIGSKTAGSTTLTAATGTTAGSPAVTLTVGGQGTAGTPLDIKATVSDGGLPILDATATATVTGPTGIVRRFPLRDDGGATDGGWRDGGYGARAFATALAGAYQVRVDIAGTSAGTPFSLSASQTVTLGPIVDGDGDGIANFSEGLVGTDPAVADATRDVDRDGLGVGAELQSGSNPFRADTDLGGEADASEIAAGRDPRSAADDVTISSPLLSAEPVDGLKIEVRTAASDATSTVRVQRVTGSTTVDLGLRAGAGATFVDGPLPAGSYTYVAWVETAGGARSAPITIGPVSVAVDATPPGALIEVNGGPAATNSTTVSVLFVDVTEPVSDMRIAESDAALASTPWVPFATSSTFVLSGGQGYHGIVAQVRDAAGNVSTPAYSVALLDTIIPTSSLGAVPAFTTNPSIIAPYSSADSGTGVDRVELWRRYRPTSTAAWSAWVLLAEGPSSPINADLDSGDGLYELATVAIDRAGNRQAMPATGTPVTLDRVAPTSATGTLAATTSTPTIAVPFTASDGLAGIATVELWSRYRATATGTWSAWALATSGAASPLTYTFAQGAGFYEFYTVAVDRAGNREAPPAVADATTQKTAGDTTPPVSASGALSTTYTTNTVTVPYTASDNASGVASVELWVRSRVNEVKPFTVWTLAATRTSSPFTYTFANGDGTYEFYTVAIDGAGNREAPPAAADSVTRRDAVNDPPDFAIPLTATRSCTGTCTNGSGSSSVFLFGEGTAVDDRSNVTVSWRLYGVAINGTSRTLLFNFKTIPGTGDQRIENFFINDTRSDAGYAWYDVEIKAAVSGASTTRTIRVKIVTGSPAT